MQDEASHRPTADEWARALEQAVTEALEKRWIEPVRDERGEIVYRDGKILYRSLVSECQERLSRGRR